jgi:hypothetical protein
VPQAAGEGADEPLSCVLRVKFALDRSNENLTPKPGEVSCERSGTPPAT